MPYTYLAADELRALAGRADVSPLFRSDSGRFWVNIVTRDHALTLVAEQHDQEADIYLVVEGEADLYLGGTILEQSSPSPGQHVGVGLDGADCRRIAKGDLIVIPEGIPHMLDARDSRIVYVVIKEDVGS